jgi:LPS-assembly protein
VITGTPGSPVVVVCNDMSLTADRIEIIDVAPGTRMIHATGNVVLIQPELNVFADAAEFNSRTRYGVFHNFTGRARLTEGQIEKSMFGTLDPDLHFNGETLERTGPDTYRLRNASFTTCAQPTARWEIGGTGGTVTVGEHVLLWNPVLRVKRVPVLYLPFIYYPIGEDERSTGILIPTYSTSTIKGTGFSNAFFLVMGRSQDATFYYDWFTKAGQGIGTEYRYAAAPGSEGNARFYMLNEKARLGTDGVTIERAGHRSYDFRGTLNQGLPRGFRLIARSNYFTDASTRQLYQQNVFDFSQRERYFGGTLSGGLGRLRLSATVEQRDFFRSDGTAIRQGRLPQVNLSIGQTPIGRSRIYVGASGDVGYFVRNDDLDDPTQNHNLWRVDASPSLRAPIGSLPFLSVTTTAKWRFTRWQESLDPVTSLQVPVPLNRQLLDLGATVTGPVFSRVWRPTDNGYASAFKHLIEPTLSVNWLSPFEELDQVVKIDGADYVVGGTTTVTYGLTNRLLARRRTEGGGAGTIRDILTVRLSQTYYSNQLAGAFDGQYQSATGATSFSPLRVNVDLRPADSFTARFNTEIDPKFRTPRQYGASGNYSTPRVQLNMGWSKRQFIPELPGYDNPAFASHFFNGTTTLSTPNNVIGGSYGFNYDILNTAFLQQRVVAYYNAQCCGIQFDYQTVSYARFGLTSVPTDRRLGISFTLAGIGSFSNPFGSFGDNSGRR